ncbi:hypothetical protein [Aureibaculum conchae]|uniref:hypothetical protein n=1 Tax=Aureibaculum sp. 2308TA14-22 TaxID=3108392 RepID=UPI003391EE6D
MKIKALFYITIFFISNTLIGQSLNEYKYVVIPSKFDFLKSENQYQLNDLAKFLFEKEGFTTIYDNVERPADLSNNVCLALTARVNNESNMFTTKLVIELINCKNQKVLISQEGRSKLKDYKKGYQEALREAFESVTAQNYKYSKSPSQEVTKTDSSDEDAQRAKMEAAADAVKNAAEEVKEEEEVIEVLEEAEPVEEVIEVVEEIEEVVEQPDPNKSTNPVNVLYAQANPLGYQLVDSSPKVVYILLNTSKKEVFLLKDKSGIVYKENGTWFVEYYDQSALLKKPLEIKF